MQMQIFPREKLTGFPTLFRIIPGIRIIFTRHTKRHRI